ncbi:hydroxyacylglutathione hydrolase [Anatilimnocola aggregata]|uniref:Hydroxyacylglutathione hydrolase n=1 Tax=Anatilimnocola aggregata TaxID=2528021 RepID=A0A517Y6C4_9BACT|nr:MBL fold metallo-hydrolase [Anatilimnocola aggregata]QDU25682.1 hydroxyacylglutathione hydrolase [Anatilimnocola aggregata]
MASAARAVPENVPGDFFVDATCIDCDTCRQLAPQTFGEGADTAFVHEQPTSGSERRQALQFLVCCPTGSIGTRGNESAKAALGDFPLIVEEPVWYCGFNSPKSYGGNSYFIEHASGNWLVDSPKFLPQLVRQFESRGGVKHIFLTHSDDVADAEQYATHFRAERIIHRHELHSQPGSERVLGGYESVQLAPEFVAIPTPGHTAGHCVLLFQNRFLFTGDHLHFDRATQRLAAFPDYCWDSWPQQVESLRRLLDFRFSWVLPGHGQRVQLPEAEMQRQLAELVASSH